MASYIVLEAPQGPDSNHSNTRFIADRFAWLALIFPFVWLAAHRLWLLALAVFLAQIIVVQLAAALGLGSAGFLGVLAISLLVALEGRQLVISHLTSRGWSLKAALPTDNLNAAEQIYYALYAREKQPTLASNQTVDWSNRAGAASGQTLDDPMGIFQFDVKGRR
jgi:hypothetical protein